MRPPTSPASRCRWREAISADEHPTISRSQPDPWSSHRGGLMTRRPTGPDVAPEPPLASRNAVNEPAARADGDTDFVMAPTVRLTAAQRAISAAIAEAERLSVDVCIAAADSAGHLLAFARMDRAPLL